LYKLGKRNGKRNGKRLGVRNSQNENRTGR
jgi:hypothetical protein